MLQSIANTLLQIVGFLTLVLVALISIDEYRYKRQKEKQRHE